MKRKFFVLLLFAVFLPLNCLLFPSEASAQRRNNRNARTDFGSEAFEIYELINSRRQRSRLRQLAWDDDVAKMARRYSEEMARGNFFSHHDRRGRSVADRAENFGLRGWTMIGENLFFCEGFDEISNLAVNGWLKSSTHKKNMLNSQWTTTGIGIASNRSGRIYITQVFLR
jgi:uncharacterized protein YkwD